MSRSDPLGPAPQNYLDKLTTKQQMKNWHLYTKSQFQTADVVNKCELSMIVSG